jgi:excisionase family DNA binding protein
LSVLNIREAFVQAVRCDVREKPRDEVSTLVNEMIPQKIRGPRVLLTPIEVAELLRTTKKAIYSMVERGQLPGIVRIGRRVLVREDALLDWLCQKSTPSLEGR